jgi:hypothetical protein
MCRVGPASPHRTAFPSRCCSTVAGCRTPPASRGREGDELARVFEGPPSMSPPRGTHGLLGHKTMTAGRGPDGVERVSYCRGCRGGQAGNGGLRVLPGTDRTRLRAIIGAAPCTPCSDWRFRGETREPRSRHVHRPPRSHIPASRRSTTRMKPTASAISRWNWWPARR